MRKGFTLIEMMIVVAIIAIIAAIAIPSLLAARRSSLETNAVGSCRAYAEAQTMYHRNDFDGNGIIEYSSQFQGTGNNPAGTVDPDGTSAAASGCAVTSFYVLHSMVDGALNPIQLLDGAFGIGDAAARAKHGYWFQDLTAIGTGASATDLSVTTGWVNDYALTAIPAVYARTGYRTFIVCTNGTTFGLDRGPTDTPTSVGTYPSNPTTEVPPWIIAE